MFSQKAHSGPVLVWEAPQLEDSPVPWPARPGTVSDVRTLPGWRWWQRWWQQLGRAAVGKPTFLSLEEAERTEEKVGEG